MAGIQDVQPKQISTLGQPLVGSVTPAATPDSVAKLADAFRQGWITADDIQKRQIQEPVLRQQAKEAISPEAIKARKEEQLLAGEKALGERETLLTKDFVAAYRRYNLPLKKADGTPDYSGMAEVGQKYADMERMRDVAKMGLHRNSVQSIDPKTNATITVFYNDFDEDITSPPGKTNPLVKKYQDMAFKARSFLVQNDKEPEVPEGGTPPKIEVQPKAMMGVPSPAPLDLSPDQTGVFPVVTPSTPAGLAPTIQTPPPAGPIIPKVTIEPPGSGQQITIAPKSTPGAAASNLYTGEGLVTGKGSFDPDKFVSDVRASGMYKNWEEKSPFIADFRGIVKAYEKLPPGSITTQNDIALATTALMLATPGASAGGRGMEGMRITKLEEAQPLLEQLLGIKGHILKEHKFEEGTRQRIIDATERKAQVLEAQGKSAVQSAENRLKDQGYDPGKYLFDPEKQLLFSGAPAGATGATSPRGRTVKLKSGRTVTLF